MLKLLPELVMGPLLVGGATLAARRWGSRIGGIVSAFPAVVGPVLLITAQARGALFAARAADGTLLGLVALSAFAVTYGRAAVALGWRACLLAGWGAAALTAGVVSWTAGGVGLPVALAAAVISLSFAHLALPRAAIDWRAVRGASVNIPVRMALTALLVVLLSAAAVVLGPLAGGVLSALPVLASLLAVFTHRGEGREAVIALLRGMLVGMAGFVGFCAVVASVVVRLGMGPAFAAAALAAVLLQVAVLPAGLRRAPS